MRFWPFGKSRPSAVDEDHAKQKAQVEAIMQRTSDAGRQRVERAQEAMTEAAEGMKAAIGCRISEASNLRDALQTLIERKSGGRFDFQRGRD